MFNKFEKRCKLGSKSAYRMLDYYYATHHERRRRFIESLPKKLMCQKCSGSGRETIDVIEWNTIWGTCGWCQGIGYLTPHERGQWLRLKRQEAQERKL